MHLKPNNHGLTSLTPLTPPTGLGSTHSANSGNSLEFPELAECPNSKPKTRSGNLPKFSGCRVPLFSAVAHCLRSLVRGAKTNPTGKPKNEDQMTNETMPEQPTPQSTPTNRAPGPQSPSGTETPPPSGPPTPAAPDALAV